MATTIVCSNQNIDNSNNAEMYELERYKPSNKFIKRDFIENVLSKLCGYGIKIGSVGIYQISFFHKTFYRKDISPNQKVVDHYLK